MMFVKAYTLLSLSLASVATKQYLGASALGVVPDQADPWEPQQWVVESSGAKGGKAAKKAKSNNGKKSESMDAPTSGLEKSKGEGGKAGKKAKSAKKGSKSKGSKSLTAAPAPTPISSLAVVVKVCALDCSTIGAHSWVIC